MKKRTSMKEEKLVQKLRDEDPLWLPMDEDFYNNLHNKIMSAVEETEIKPVSKWEKTWIFLERKTKAQREFLKKAAKMGLASMFVFMGFVSVNAPFYFYAKTVAYGLDKNKNSIIAEAKKSPLDWNDLALSYQTENDFYAEVLSEKSSETLVELDQALASAL